jgi:ketosteroid isomerase-like protein
VCFLLCTFLHRAESGVIRQKVSTKHHVDPDSAIRKSLNRLNEVLATKDLQTVMSLYDNSDDIIVVGSDSGEVFIGKERVQEFMKVIISMPFTFSFDMDQISINHNKNIAWVFVDGKMVHTRSNGKVSKVPYRIMAVMVKKSDDWKWKVFSGSIPRGE